jgi:hypothetical protein
VHKKYQACIELIHAVLRINSCTEGELETLLEGQLNHAAHLVPITQHFLMRVCKLKDSKSNKWSLVRVTEDEVTQDLRLWKEILVRANQGVSMNLVVKRQPTGLCWSDSCPLLGVGGLVPPAGQGRKEPGGY